MKKIIPDNRGDSPKTSNPKKNQIKTYNEFIKMIIKDEKMADDIFKPQKTNEISKITPLKEKTTKINNNPEKNQNINILKNNNKQNIQRKVYTPKHDQKINFDETKKKIEEPKKEIIISQFNKSITPIKDSKIFNKNQLVKSSSKSSIQIKYEKNKISNANELNTQNKIHEFKECNSVSSKNLIENPTNNIHILSKIVNIEKEYSSQNSENSSKSIHNLTEDEKTSYGDRHLENYEKKELLGKGGFALVWLGFDKLHNNRKVAMKQIIKSNSENCKKELMFGELFFDENGRIREEFNEYNGINHITQLLHHKMTSKDQWLVFELGGSTLSKILYEMKGQFFKGERVYSIKYSPLYNKFISDLSLLKRFISSIAESLLLFSDYGIVHSDLKPDNILLETNKTNDDFTKLKIIDFGSAYHFNDSGNISMATPEYMPPEVLELLTNSNRYTGPHKTQIEALSEVNQPWSVDVWSLGVIILEIIIGIPLWISYKCKVIGKKGKEILKTGLLAVKGRTYDKIIAKQKSLIENLEKKIEDHFDYNKGDVKLLVDLMIKILEWNPKKRISPKEILKHPFLGKNL